MIICKTNLLQEKNKMLFAGLGSVRVAEDSIFDFRPKVTGFHYTDLPAGKHLTRIGNRVVHAGIILSIIVIHEHQALRQHNSKKNSRKYVKVSKIAFCTFLKLEFLIPWGEICVTIDCPRLHHRKPTWPCGVTGSLRLIYLSNRPQVSMVYITIIP